jgi:Xaa-Pro aminopeptidase
MRKLRGLPLVAALLTPALLEGQSPLYYQPHFQPEEFKARWDKIFSRIGSSGVAILQGMPKVNGFIFPRQNNEFYYLCGIETPHAYLVLDGKSRQATLYLPPRDIGLERAEGKILAANDAALVKKTGRRG